MNPILNFLGYAGIIVVGISLIYCAAKAIAHLSELSNQRKSKFLDFISLHSYGCTITLIFILIGFAVLSAFTLMEKQAYESLEAEREQLSDERSYYYDSGYESGYEEGYEYGHNDGYDDGYNDGYDAAS